MRTMKKDYTFEKVMETQKELKDTDGFDWLESTELAIDKRKFLRNREATHSTRWRLGLYFDCYTVFCSQYKCISNQYLVCCSIAVYFFVKGTSDLLFGILNVTKTTDFLILCAKHS